MRYWCLLYRHIVEYENFNLKEQMCYTEIQIQAQICKKNYFLKKLDKNAHMASDSFFSRSGLGV